MGADCDGDPVDLTGAELWFAVKASETDPDSAALLFLTSAAGEIVITSAAAGAAQIDLTSDQTQPTAGFQPNRTYYAFLKVQLASGEIRVVEGWLTTTAGGITAPAS